MHVPWYQEELTLGANRAATRPGGSLIDRSYGLTLDGRPHRSHRLTARIPTPGCHPMQSDRIARPMQSFPYGQVVLPSDAAPAESRAIPVPPDRDRVRQAMTSPSAAEAPPRRRCRHGDESPAAEFIHGTHSDEGVSQRRADGLRLLQPREAAGVLDRNEYAVRDECHGGAGGVQRQRVRHAVQ